jgi:putative restriction endonuclease
MVRLFIANTDNDWFDFLSAEPDLTEVNFWRPSPQAFHAIQPGELFVFRLKNPRNKIGGFGVLSDASVFPLQVAWETFGRFNGVSSLEALRAIIQNYRPDEVVGPSTNIGCRILAPAFFFPEHLWLDLPSSWPRNIQGGKRFSTDDPQIMRLWSNLLDLARLSTTATIGVAEPAARYGNPTLITPRLGQGAFRIAVTEAYGRQCAISGGKVLPALDAAHIRPYAEGGTHTKSNGILLRKDIHSVFDSGYATIDTDLRFVVSSKVKEVFDNGEEYRRLHGAALRPPLRGLDHPDPEFLRWHNENRFLG